MILAPWRAPSRRQTLHAEKVNSLLSQIAGRWSCFEVRVAGIDDEVALFEVRYRSPITESQADLQAPASSPARRAKQAMKSWMLAQLVLWFQLIPS